VGLGLGVSIVSPLVALDYLHAGLEMRPFRPAIRFTSYLLLADHKPAGNLTLAFAAEIRATLQEAVRRWQ
ncbi:LysR family transcriptional regulator, partial [Pseudomonas oryzihabitans]